MSTLPAAPASTRNLYLRARLCLFAAAAFLVSALSLAGALQPAVAVPLSIAAVAVAMAHGAYDHLGGERLLAPRYGRRWPLPFFAGYLLLFALTLLGWRLFPTASLMLFLLYSAWHFGLEPERAWPRPSAAVCGFALGLLPIAAACRRRPEAVAPIFARMLGHAGGHAAPLTAWFGAALVPTCAVAAVGIAGGLLGGSAERRAELAAAAALQLLLFAVCDPLTAFAVFFCCWHTPEHLLATSMPGDLRRNLTRNLRAGFGPWLLSLGGLGVLLLLAGRGAVAHAGALFVLLSALTVPHMALEELRRLGAD